ncbi:MAG: D-tyrosyl-tRNA(Tyr) deacylase [Saprospiraceae bacterium]|nr:D-tyrosyl-tRNA(Tyr) deacylase [Saprospiraceae bacterium]
MRVVIQRVAEASVSVQSRITGSIGAGLLILLGVEEIDSIEDIEWLVSKICNLRIFNDQEGKMNLNFFDAGMDGMLVVSQFTLFASTKKGNRPSFIRSAAPQKAETMYNAFIDKLKAAGIAKVESGIFGADMKVKLLNDGPVTIIIDSKQRE